MKYLSGDRFYIRVLRSDRHFGAGSDDRSINLKGFHQDYSKGITSNRAVEEWLGLFVDPRLAPQRP